MNLEVDLWELIVALVMFLAGVAGLVWGIIRVLLGQYEKHQDERYQLLLNQIAGVRSLEAEFARWQLQVSEKFVHREDYIRGQTVLEAKLDAIGVRQQLSELRAAQTAKELTR